MAFNMKDYEPPDLGSASITAHREYMRALMGTDQRIPEREEARRVWEAEQQAIVDRILNGRLLRTR